MTKHFLTLVLALSTTACFGASGFYPMKRQQPSLSPYVKKYLERHPNLAHCARDESVYKQALLAEAQRRVDRTLSPEEVNAVTRCANYYSGFLFVPPEEFTCTQIKELEVLRKSGIISPEDYDAAVAKLRTPRRKTQ